MQRLCTHPASSGNLCHFTPWRSRLRSGNRHRHHAAKPAAAFSNQHYPVYRSSSCSRRRIRTQAFSGQELATVAADAQDAAAATSFSLPVFAALGALLAATGLLGWKFWLYSQLEYIKAAMLTRYIVKGDGGAKVIQLGGGTKELYYYPKDINLLTYVGEGLNKSLIEQGAVQAGVPAVVKQQPATNLGFAADGSVDAVVALQALSRLSAQQRRHAVREALRVLKPGRPLVFVERLNAGGAPLQGLLGNPSEAISKQVLDELNAMQGFDYVEWDEALAGQDPHAVGVAVKSQVAPRIQRSTSSSTGSSTSSGSSAGKGSRKAAKAPSTKGFQPTGAPSSGGSG